MRVTCLGRSEDNLGCCPRVPSTFCLKQGFLLARTITMWPWIHYPFSHLATPETASEHRRIWLFMACVCLFVCFLGLEIRSSHFQGKYFTDQGNSPAHRQVALNLQCLSESPRECLHAQVVRI